MATILTRKSCEIVERTRNRGCGWVGASLSLLQKLSCDLGDADRRFRPPKETPDPAVKRISLGPTDRDVALAHVEKEKSLSFIKAWEESEKAKVDNKAQKKLAAVSSWENTKKAAIEAKLKKN